MHRLVGRRERRKFSPRIAFSLVCLSYFGLNHNSAGRLEAYFKELWKGELWFCDLFLCTIGIQTFGFLMTEAIKLSWIHLSRNKSLIELIQLDQLESSWIKMNQIESRWIKVNQGESKWIKVNQGESRWIKVNQKNQSKPMWIKMN